MAKLTKDYFLDNEVLIVGYPTTDDPSMKMILPAFLNNGIKILALNDKASGDREVKLYKNITDLPHVPKCAYIYLDKPDIDSWITVLAAAGVKRVLFHSKKDVDPNQMEACKKAGIETAVACPMMLLGGGIHKFHKFLAGV